MNQPGASLAGQGMCGHTGRVGIRGGRPCDRGWSIRRRRRHRPRVYRTGDRHIPRRRQLDEIALLGLGAALLLPGATLAVPDAIAVQRCGAVAARLRIRLIGKSNGVGLSRDLELLAGALAACGLRGHAASCARRDRKASPIAADATGDVASQAPRTRHASAFDVNVMLEHIWPQFVQQARLNVLVPKS